MHTVSASSTQHRPWSTVLLVSHTFGMVCAAAVIAGAIVLVVVTANAPAPQDGGPIEPYGLVIAPMLAFGGLLLLAMYSWLWRLTVRGRREADVGRSGPLRRCAVESMISGTLASLVAVVGAWFWRGAEGIALVLVIYCLHLVVAVLTMVRAGTPGLGGR